MRPLAGLTLCVLFACDSRATASDPAAQRAEQRSKEYESCSASGDCQDSLRCLDHICSRSGRSIVGDYYVAHGIAARADGRVDVAVASFATAVGQYEAEKVPVPPDVDCAYGGALAAAKANPELAERAARVLHRCVLAVPPGSLRNAALAELASLADAGLDPLLLGATKPADRYLTKGPTRPATDKLAVTVAAKPTPGGKGWAKLAEKLDSEARAGLIECWGKHYDATKQPSLAVTLGLKIAFLTNPDYEGEGAWLVKLDPASPSGDDACVHGVIEPIVKAAKLAEVVDTKLTISIK